MQVEVVLDAAVAIAEDDQGLEFLRDHGFARVRQRLRRWETEQRWKRAGLRRRPYRIAEPHVDLQDESRRAAACGQEHTRAGVLLLGADRLDADAGRIEVDGVGIHGDRADRHQVPADRFWGSLAAAQQVQIASRPVRLLGLHAKQHRALEYESVMQRRSTEPVEEPLEAEAREQCLVVVARRSRLVEQACCDRSREVGLLGHAISSR